jgi:hypothetical protein
MRAAMSGVVYRYWAPMPLPRCWLTRLVASWPITSSMTRLRGWLGQGGHWSAPMVVGARNSTASRVTVMKASSSEACWAVSSSSLPRPMTIRC